MKFVYQYKTSDGERHSGVYRAHNRDAVFSELKQKGIRPFGVEPAPGFFNRLSGIGVRWVVILVLALALTVTLLAGRHSPQGDDGQYRETFDGSERRQLVGDLAIIEEGVASGWSIAFEDIGDRFLSSFAIPGVIGGVATTSVEAVARVINVPVPVHDGDAIEVRQIKGVVEGMKDEIRQFVADGGSIRQYCRLMVDRQKEEIALRQRAETEIATAIARGADEGEVMACRSKLNVELRRVGLMPLPLPDFDAENAEEGKSKKMRYPLAPKRKK